MKKLYTLLGLMIAFLCGTQQANAFQILIKANTDQVSVRMGKNATSDVSFMTTGYAYANTASDNYIIVNPKENCSIKEMRIYDDDPGSLLNTITPEEGKIEYDASAHASLGWYYVEIDSQDGAGGGGGGEIEQPTSVKAKCYIDTYPKNTYDVISEFKTGDREQDADKFYSYYSQIEFNPETEKNFTLTTKDGYYFKYATLNGEDIPFTSSGDSNIYTFEVNEGDAIEFQVPLQDTKVSANFTFNYGDLNASDVISSFSNGNAVPEDLYSGGEHQIEFKTGSEGTFTLVTKDNYIFSTASLNGSAIQYQPTEGVDGSYTYTFTVPADATVVFENPVKLTQATAKFTFNYAAKSKGDVLLYFYKKFDSYNNSGTSLLDFANEGENSVEFTSPVEEKFAVVTTNKLTFDTATKNGENLTPVVMYDWTDKYYIYTFVVADGDEFVFAMNEPMVKATFTFDYGDVTRDKVISRFFKNYDLAEGTGTRLDDALTDAGTREIEFLPSEGKFALVTNSAYEFVTTTINGEPFEKSETKFMGLLPLYYLELKDGDNVVFSMKDEVIPDPEPVSDAHVTFSFENDDVKELIYTVSATIEGKNQSMNWSDGFEIAPNSKITIQLNSSKTRYYKNIALTSNGENIAFSDNYINTTITVDTEIHVSATKLDFVDVTVNIDNPANAIFKAFNGTYSATPVTLENAGDNIISLKEESTTDYSTNPSTVVYGFKFVVEAAENCEILSITDEEGNEVWQPSTYSPNRFLRNGTKIFITTKRNEPDPGEDFEVYMYISTTDNLVFKDKSGYNMIDDEDFLLDDPLVSGYQTVPMNTNQNPFYLSNCEVYINGEMQTDRDMSFSDGDFVMVFQGRTPATHTVSIDLPADVEAVVKKHHTDEVSDLSAIEMYEGTELRIEPTGSKKIWVYVPSTTPVEQARSLRAAEGEEGENEEAKLIKDNGDGSFTVKVNEKTANLRVSHNDPTGINQIISEIDDNAEVYNLQGLRISDNAKNLPAGIYIVNGKKILLDK